MSRHASSLLSACASLGLVLSLASGCNAIDFAPLVTATTTISEEFKTSATPKLVIDTFNGAIDISEGEGDEVVVEVTKRAGGFDREAAEANLDYIEVSIVQKDENTIHVVAKRLGRQLGTLGASVVVAAPKMARLQLRSSNGHVVCEAMQGGINATTSNGKIEVIEGSGAIDVTTSNGSIDIEAVAATVDAQLERPRQIRRVAGRQGKRVPLLERKYRAGPAPRQPIPPRLLHFQRQDPVRLPLGEQRQIEPPPPGRRRGRASRSFGHRPHQQRLNSRPQGGFELTRSYCRESHGVASETAMANHGCGPTARPAIARGKRSVAPGAMGNPTPPQAPPGRPISSGTSAVSFDSPRPHIFLSPPPAEHTIGRTTSNPRSTRSCSECANGLQSWSR